MGHNSSLLSPTVSLNCHPSKLINIRPNSSQVISRPSIMRSGTRPSWAIVPLNLASHDSIVRDLQSVLTVHDMFGG